MARMREYSVILPVLSLYDSSECSRVATEAWAGRHFRLVECLDFSSPSNFKDPVKIVFCEDRYECWLAPEDAKRAIVPVEEGQEYQARVVEKDEVQERMSDVINFVTAAIDMKIDTSGVVLPGLISTAVAWVCFNPFKSLLGPEIGTSRLLCTDESIPVTAVSHVVLSAEVQRAYSFVGIWLPRDAYQQEEFVEKVLDKDLKRGDLLFFGVEKATHVGICVEVPSGDEGCGDNEGDTFPVKYIHSSSSTHGHGHIELDELALNAGSVAKYYFSMYRGSGRIVRGL